MRVSRAGSDKTAWYALQIWNHFLTLAYSRLYTRCQTHTILIFYFYPDNWSLCNKFLYKLHAKSSPRFQNMYTSSDKNGNYESKTNIVQHAIIAIETAPVAVTFQGEIAREKVSIIMSRFTRLNTVTKIVLFFISFRTKCNQCFPPHRVVTSSYA